MAPMQSAASQNPIVVELQNVSRSIRAGLTGCSADARALDRVSLVVRHSEIVLLTGRRGSGKTALLHCAAGVMTPDTGCVTWAGSAKPPSWIALAGARDLRQAAPTVGESIEESIGCATRSVWSIDALVTRTMTDAMLNLPRLTRVCHLSPTQRTRLRIARALVRTTASHGAVRFLLIDGSADDEPLALRGDDLHSIATRLDVAVIAAANSLGIDGCVVPRTLVLEHGRLIADLRQLAPAPLRAPTGATARRSPVRADVDPLPALL